MGHDATKVLMGSSGSSDKDVSAFTAVPADYPAGIAVRLKSDGTISKLSTDGQYIGVSMGASLSDTSKIAVARSGNYVPVKINAGICAKGTVTISNVSNLLSTTADTVEVADVVFTAQAGAATPGDATFRAATGNTETAASLAAQINAHAAASLLVKAYSSGAVCYIHALENGTGGNALTLVYVDSAPTSVGLSVSGSGTLSGGSASSTFAALGASVYFNKLTGVAEENTNYSVVSGATYVSGALTAVEQDGTEASAAYVDMAGGL